MIFAVEVVWEMKAKKEARFSEWCGMTEFVWYGEFVDISDACLI